MSQRIIVTSGDKFTDIDAFAGCIAQAELLKLQGYSAVAILPGPLNSSIPGFLKEISVDFETNYQTVAGDIYDIVDISDPRYIASFVDQSRINKIIDHHPGYEDYWRTQNVGMQIENIGAASALVAENWFNARIFHQMPEDIAKLLTCAIIDNTLNFTATVTSSRDCQVYDKLLSHAGLNNSWSQIYFTACQKETLENLELSLANDTKRLYLSVYGKTEIACAQLALWDPRSILRNIEQVFIKKELNTTWLVNTISIKEGKSYFMTKDLKLQTAIKTLLGVKFNDGLAISERPWLRKEIIKRDLEPQ